ncbi:unnamed protein product, partial [marine sediment metagenome]
MAIYDYKYEHFTDFIKKQNKENYLEGIKVVEDYLGKEYHLVINGEIITTENKYTSRNPAIHTEVIGEISQASIEHAEKAITIAHETFNTWKNSLPQMRADILLKSAGIIRRRKFEFAALMTKEAG